VSVDQCVSAIIAVEVAVFVCLRSSCNHVTGRIALRFVRLALKVVMQNSGDFMDIILLHLGINWKIILKRILVGQFAQVSSRFYNMAHGDVDENSPSIITENFLTKGVYSYSERKGNVLFLRFTQIQCS
jgi:hypothetical protein